MKRQTSGASPAAATSRSGQQTLATRVGREICGLDLLMIVIAVVVGLVAQWGRGAPLLQDHSRQLLALAILIVWPTMLWLRGTRASDILVNGGEEYRRVLEASIATTLFIAAGAYFTNTTRARAYIVGVMILGTILILLGRWLMRGSLQRRMNAGNPLRRIFIVCAPHMRGNVEAEVEKAGSRLVTVGAWSGGAANINPADVVAAALRVGADTILYLPLMDSDASWTQRLGWAMEGTSLSLLVSPAVMQVAGPRLHVRQMEGMAFLSVEMPHFTGPARFLKRTLDIVGGTVGLVVIAIPAAIIAIWIKHDSPGPVLYRQERMGRDGQTFTCLKFRTMSEGADQRLAAMRTAQGDEGATFKDQEDPRITRVGRFLRRSSLDEVPQLWNVVRNEMSLVGPRPHQLADVERYDEAANRRLLAKPGMTGLWQVSGRSDTSWNENVVLDLYYVENWSFALDLVILARTVKTVLTGSGAY